MEPAVPELLEGLAARLASDEAAASLRRDPYWPKWDSPWWHMTLLWEMDEAARIPRRAAETLADTVSSHYLKVFPLREGELPPGADPYRHILCHCALGTAWQVLEACGISASERLPWARPWLARYRLPDGGWNCDEAAYTRATPRSSVVSTLPVLEVLLSLPDRTAQEEAMLDEGADYLLARSLFRSLSKGGAVIDAAWLKPAFPLFYEYDVLRGLAFLARWGRLRGRELPPASVRDAAAAVRKHAVGGTLAPGRRAWDGARTIAPDGRGGWEKRPAADPFALLERVSRVGEPNPWLQRRWDAVAPSFAGLWDRTPSDPS
ncbi:MAG: hypothetical protein KGL53_09535 [Elusimicrobia bacterium]|nr:hypothetical protein [Elusimicrobiota bacterium]